MSSLRSLTEAAGLSLEEILNVSQEEFKGWSKVACKSDVIARASVFSEWKRLRNETYGDGSITSLQTLCDQAGLPMQEVLTLSKNDFRHLTKVMQVDCITQHTLLFQEKMRILETLRGENQSDASAASHLLVNIASPKKTIETWRQGEQNVEQQNYADVRNDDESREQYSSLLMGGQQAFRDAMQDEASLLNEAVSAQDENSLLNDVLMCSHNIDPKGSGQLSLEFVWQLANTQKQAVEPVLGNEVVFAGGRSKIGTRRFIKFVESFRSLFIMSNEDDRKTLAGLLVLVAQTRGYRFLRMDNNGELLPVGEEYARERTIEILLPAKSKVTTPFLPSAIIKYPRGQTRFTQEEDDIIVETVLNSVEHSVGEPFTSWARLAEKLPGYKSKQIRDRWVNHLNPNINHKPFSEEDDVQLYQALSVYGRKWAEISAAVFNSTRPENQVKNRRHSAAFRKFVIKKYGQAAFDAIETKTEAGKRKVSKGETGHGKRVKTC